MKYVRSFDSFKKNKPVNEELLGGLLNWFKKMWDKAIKEIEELENDPNKIKEWVINNALNPKDDTNVFSQVMKDFQKKDTASDQDCIDLIDNILDPQTGSLGKQGIGVLLANKAMQGEKLKAKRAMLEFIINTARNKTIADPKVKFAGGPADGKIDPKKKTVDLKDMGHLPDLKKILVSQKDDEKKKKDETLKWVSGVLILLIQNYVKAVKEDDIRAYVNKLGIKLEESVYKKGDSVIYLLKDHKKDEWDKLADDQKEKPKEDPANKIVGVHKVEIVDGDNITLLDQDGKPTIVKTKEEIIGKFEEQRGPNAEELAKNLGDIKADEEKMKQVNAFTDIIKDPVANKAKIDQINKIIGGGEAK